MATPKSPQRRTVAFHEYAQERMTHIRNYLTPFQDETSTVRQSWFHDLLEWYHKVLFPNLQESNKLVERVRAAFWTLADGEEFDEDFLSLAKRAQGLFAQLDEQHARLDEKRRLFEIIRTMSHDLSDSIEVINGDLETLARDVSQYSTSKPR